MNYLKTSLTFAFVLAFSGAFAQAKADYDKNTDFSKYKTYSFAGWQNGSDAILNDFDKKRIHEAFGNEFAARGMKYVESGGDAMVTLFIMTQDKTNTTAYTNYTGGMGYRGRYGYAGGFGTSTTTISESEYTEGTLIVDMYDEGTKDLVWQGILSSTVKENPQKREKSIPKNVNKLMKKFPVKPIK
jgi:hypothetical protein